jgi:hypothetical protein
MVFVLNVNAIKIHGAVSIPKQDWFFRVLAILNMLQHACQSFA